MIEEVKNMKQKSIEGKDLPTSVPPRIEDVIKQDRQHILQAICKEVEGKWKTPYRNDSDEEKAECFIYNQALEDILTLLDTLEKEL